MKTIAIINSQNVKSEHLLVVIIPSFKEESSVSAWTSSTEVANTELLKLPLDDLKSFRHRQAELHVIQVIAWNISICMCSFVDLWLYLMCMHAATIYSYSYKGCSVNHSQSI